MSNRRDSISRDEYFARIDNGIPYEGVVDGMGYALQEIEVTPYRSAESDRSPIFFDVSFINVGVASHIPARKISPVAANPSSPRGGWVQRNNEIFYDREVTSQAEADDKYGRNKVKYLQSGQGTNGKYRLSKENNGTVYDRDGNRLDNTETIYEDGFVIYATCDHCLDPATIRRNLFGLSYPGPNNPKDYENVDTYEYIPRCPTEYPAIGHDKRYENLKIKGASGLLLNVQSLGADYQFVAEELIIGYTHWNPVVRFKARAMAFGLGLMALPKTIKFIFIDNLHTPIIKIPEIIKENYNISNVGVDNNPCKNEPYTK